MDDNLPRFENYANTNKLLEIDENTLIGKIVYRIMVVDDTNGAYDRDLSEYDTHFFVIIRSVGRKIVNARLEVVGWSVEGGSDAGLALLLEAARDGNADAQQTVARLFRDGKGVAQDPALAEQWLRFAIENGSARAKYELAGLMMKKARVAGVQLTPAQTSELVGLLTDAARDGSGSAAKAIGLVLLKGGFSPENLRAVRAYAEQAFDTGRTDAAFLMAMTYALEKEGDPDTALQWLELDAAGKDWKSRYARQLVRNGTDVTQALKTAAGATYQDWVESSAASAEKTTSSGVTPPKIISMTPPKFPSGFASLDVKGSAVVEFVVAQDGIPQAVQVIRSTHPEFADAAVKAVLTWKLEPAQKDGKYAPLKVRFPVNFKNSL